MAEGEGHREDKNPDQPVEKVNEERTGSEKEEEPELEPKKKIKPPTIDEYQWQWKVGDRSSHFVPHRTHQMPQPGLETTRRTFFL